MRHRPLRVLNSVCDHNKQKDTTHLTHTPCVNLLEIFIASCCTTQTVTQKSHIAPTQMGCHLFGQQVFGVGREAIEELVSWGSQLIVLLQSPNAILLMCQKKHTVLVKREIETEGGARVLRPPPK